MLSVDSIDLCHHGRFRDVYELDLFPSENKPRPAFPTAKTPEIPGRTGPGNTSGVSGSSHKNGHTLVSPRSYSGHPLPKEAAKSPGGSTGYGAHNNRHVTSTPSYLFSNEVDHGPAYKGYKPNNGKDSHVNHRESSIVVPRNILVTNSGKSSGNRPKYNNSMRMPLFLQDLTPGRKFEEATRNTLLKTGPLTRLTRAVGYKRNSHNSTGSHSANYHMENNYNTPWNDPRYQFPQQENENTFPEVLPRLATVRFVRIATYHLSQLPPSGSMRKGRAEVTAPLPISIDKPMFKSMPPYYPYRGIVNHPRVPKRGRSSGGSGYRPSSSVITQSLAHPPHDLHPFYDHGWPLQQQYLYPYGL